MDDVTVSCNPALDAAFEAFLLARELGQAEAVQRLLREHPGLAEKMATHDALCAYLPKLWNRPDQRYEGRMLGDFELLHKIGEGGQGVVYKAWQKSLRRVVAVKIMRHDCTRERDSEQFLRDGRLLADLRHPNIVDVYSAGESEGRPYFVMELMAESLKDKLRNGWLPTPEQAAEIMRDLARAIQFAHDKHIVHRDLKPGNILMKADGTPKIVDFGLAKQLDASQDVTQSGVLIGTMSYMSPEAARCEPLNSACDIYGLGVILYELLTGRPPFVGASVNEMLEQVCENDPVPIKQIRPELPDDLETVCLLCMNKDAAERYGSASELAVDLQRVVDEEPILKKRPSLTRRAWRALLRQQFTNVAVWGWIILIGGFTGAALHLLQASLILEDVPIPISRSGHAAFVLFLVALHVLAFRGRTLEPGDRRGIVSTTALILGSAFLAVVHPPTADLRLMEYRMEYRLSFYPLFGFVNAIVFFMQGPTVWGGFYLYGAAFLVLAVAMVLLPLWSPILFGLFIAATQIPLGWFILRLDPSSTYRK